MSGGVYVTFTSLLPQASGLALSTCPGPSWSSFGPTIPAYHLSHHAGPSASSQHNENKRKRTDLMESHTPEESRENKRAKTEVISVQPAVPACASFNAPSTAPEIAACDPQRPRATILDHFFDVEDDSPWVADLQASHDRAEVAIIPTDVTASQVDPLEPAHPSVEPSFEYTSSTSYGDTSFAGDDFDPLFFGPGDDSFYLDDSSALELLAASHRTVGLLRLSYPRATPSSGPPPTRFRRAHYIPKHPSPLRYDITEELLDWEVVLVVADDLPAEPVSFGGSDEDVFQYVEGCLDADVDEEA